MRTGGPWGAMGRRLAGLVHGAVSSGANGRRGIGMAQRLLAGPGDQWRRNPSAESIAEDMFSP